MKVTITATCANILICIGGFTYLTAAILDDDMYGAIRAAGVVLLIGGIVRATMLATVRKIIQPQADVYEAGVEQGYDKGYHDGRRSVKLSVVPICKDQELIQSN